MSAHPAKIVTSRHCVTDTMATDKMCVNKFEFQDGRRSIQELC
jgi:hypothetical protein